MSCRDLLFYVNHIGSVSCDYSRISIFWFFCGGHLVRNFVFFSSKRPREICPHLTSHNKKFPSSDNHLGILSDLIAILDAILYFLTLPFERYIPSFKQSQR